MSIQIREIGKRIQVHRAFYVPTKLVTVVGEDGEKYTVPKKGTGRNKTEMLGSFESRLLGVSELDTLLATNITEKLEGNDRYKIESWVNSWLVKTGYEKARLLPESLPLDLELLAKKMPYLSVSQGRVDKILDAFDLFKAAVRKEKSLILTPAIVRQKKDSTPAKK